MSKVIIFSHESDIDGLGCVILAKLAFNEVDYVLVPNTEKLEVTFRNYLDSHKLDEYDMIYITDLALYDPALTMVSKSPIKDKVRVFDHHKAAIENNMNRYPFTKIIEDDENGNKFGIVYANYEYRNELAEYIKNKKNPEEIKYFIVVAMDKGEFGQKSYRSIEEAFDVNVIAMNHGGGGHPGAASVNITKDQKEKSLVLSKRKSLKYLADSKYLV